MSEKDRCPDSARRERQARGIERPLMPKKGWALLAYMYNDFIGHAPDREGALSLAIGAAKLDPEFEGFNDGDFALLTDQIRQTYPNL